MTTALSLAVNSLARQASNDQMEKRQKKEEEEEAQKCFICLIAYIVHVLYLWATPYAWSLHKLFC